MVHSARFLIKEKNMEVRNMEYSTSYPMMPTLHLDANEVSLTKKIITLSNPDYFDGGSISEYVKDNEKALIELSEEVMGVFLGKETYVPLTALQIASIFLGGVSGNAQKFLETVDIARETWITFMTTHRKTEKYQFAHFLKSIPEHKDILVLLAGCMPAHSDAVSELFSKKKHKRLAANIMRPGGYKHLNARHPVILRPLSIAGSSWYTSIFTFAVLSYFGIYRPSTKSPVLFGSPSKFNIKLYEDANAPSIADMKALCSTLGTNGSLSEIL
jgi:hypothetical protein